MYSSLQLAFKFIRYYITSSNGKGHGVHSPFVFDFIKNVLNDKALYPVYTKVEDVRKELFVNDAVLTIEDFGAGSTVSKTNERKVRDIARSALKPPKWGQLLFRIVHYYKPLVIVELGTSLGITSSYLASVNDASKVITLEGSHAVAEVAQTNFEKLSLKNISLIEGNFDNTLHSAIQNLSVIDFAFVDGNHRKEPTIRYFEHLLAKANENSIFVFDDIHWSKEMEEAWHYIQQHPSVTLTIDLFFIGIVFFRREQKVKQHFTIRY